MAKRKEIKFWDRGYVLEGRQGNLTFAIYDDNTEEILKEKTYYVVVRHKEIESLGFSTAGYHHFTLSAAKEFCQKIAAGEIDPEALLMEFAAEDMEKEQAAVREITEKANILDIDNLPIEGLYGAGDMAVGSIYGDAPANAGGTVYGSMTIGMVAGDAAAAFVKGEN